MVVYFTAMFSQNRSSFDHRPPPHLSLPTPAYFPGIKHTQKRRLAYTVILEEEESEYARKGIEGMANTGSCHPLEENRTTGRDEKILYSDDDHVKYHYPQTCTRTPASVQYTSSSQIIRGQSPSSKRKGKEKKGIFEFKQVNQFVTRYACNQCTSQYHFQKGLLILWDFYAIGLSIFMSVPHRQGGVG